MSKSTGKSPAAGPWSRPCAGANRNSKSHATSGSAQAPSTAGSATPRANDSTGSIGPIARGSHTPPSEPRPASRTWSWRCAASCRSRATWVSMGPKRSSRPCGAATSSRFPRSGPSTASSAGAACWMAGSGPDGLRPLRAWYLPEVACRSRELDSVDAVEGLVIKGGPQVEVLNTVSLQGGLGASWPRGESVTAKFVVECLVEHWREFGPPGYAQFDNDTIFPGPHTHPDVVGRVSRLCLGLGVVPVFVPPREPGFQAAIENYNGSWQAKVWGRFEHADLEALADRSRRHVAAWRRHRADRIEAAPPRSAFPRRWHLNLQARLKGRMVYVRRTDAEGRAEVLGRAFEVDRHWAHRLIRAEVDLDAGQIRFYRLRRREPGDQPLLRETAHRIPAKPFHE